MRWLVAGISFAAVLVLALWTAIVRAENTRRRLHLDDSAKEVHIAKVAVEAEAVRAKERTDLDKLLLSWARMRGIELEGDK